MQVPDLSKLAWQLNVALMAAIFSAVSLIYNDEYIYYGFVTFVFGAVSHFVSTWFDFVFAGDNQRDKRQKFFIVQATLLLIWVAMLLIIYSNIRA